MVRSSAATAVMAQHCNGSVWRVWREVSRTAAQQDSAYTKAASCGSSSSDTYKTHGISITHVWIRSVPER
jgi:hypothetical protein